MLLINLYKISWNRKYTQAEIVKATGLSTATVNKLFSGEPHNFSFKSVETIAKFLGCKALDIIVEIPDERK